MMLMLMLILMLVMTMIAMMMIKMTMTMIMMTTMMMNPLLMILKKIKEPKLVKQNSLVSKMCTFKQGKTPTLNILLLHVYTTDVDGA